MIAALVIVGGLCGFIAFGVLLPYGLAQAAQEAREDCEDRCARLCLEEDDRHACASEFEGVVPGFQVGVARDAEGWLAGRERSSR